MRSKKGYLFGHNVWLFYRKEKPYAWTIYVNIDSLGLCCSDCLSILCASCNAQTHTQAEIYMHLFYNACINKAYLTIAICIVCVVCVYTCTFQLHFKFYSYRQHDTQIKFIQWIVLRQSMVKCLPYHVQYINEYHHANVVLFVFASVVSSLFRSQCPHLNYYFEMLCAPHESKIFIWMWGSTTTYRINIPE